MAETQPNFTPRELASGELLRGTTEFRPGDQLNLHLSQLRSINEAHTQITETEMVKSSPEVQARLPHQEAGMITLYVIHQRRSVDSTQVRQGDLDPALN